jgi:predicted NBD/HSP70 family sugar kinase
MNQVEQKASEISEMTKLSVMTVNAVLKDMLEDGEVSVSLKKMGKGRPSTFYTYNSEYICGCIIYAREVNEMVHVKLAITDTFSRKIHEDDFYFSNLMENDLIKIVSEVKESYPSLGSVLLGFPGIIEDDKILSSDFTSFSTNFITDIKNNFEIDLMFLNDINAATYGYSQMENEKDVVGLYFPENFNPGAGIVLDQEVHFGVRGFAGEVGHIKLGVPWTDLSQKDQSTIVTQIASLGTIVSSMIAPETIILYGEYIDSSHCDLIQEKINASFNGLFEIELVYRESLMSDFEVGLLFCLENNLSDVYLKKL